MTAQIRSIQDVRDSFRRCGVTVTDWAKQNGFSPSVVYSVLSGRCHGHRGEAHRVAVALQLKQGERVDDQVLMRLPPLAKQLDGRHERGQR